MIVKAGIRWINLDQVVYVKDTSWEADDNTPAVVMVDIHFNGDSQLHLRGNVAEEFLAILETVEKKIVFKADVID